MKKILLTIVLLAVGAVHADYLFWMVGDNPQSGTDISGNPTSFAWTDAKLVWDGGSMDLTADDAALHKSLDSYAIADVGSEYSSQSFYIELWNGDKWLAKSPAALGSSLAQFISGSNSLNPVAGTGWAPTSYSVPEPTSGLLFVIGGMLLGLKRKRQV
jgi:hypothetical protein